jgi:hypothetical protein
MINIHKTYAQIGKEVGCFNKEGLDYFLCKLEGLIWIFYWFSLILGIFFIILAAYKYTISQGKDWHSELIYIILGIVLIIISFSLPVIIFSFLGY